MATRPIVISIQGDDSDLRRALKSASDGVKGFGKSVAKIGARAGVAFAATAGAIGVKGVTAFADFEKGMNEVMTLLPDAGEGAFQDLSGQVKDFAKEFGVLQRRSFRAFTRPSQPGCHGARFLSFLRPARWQPKAGSRT